MQLVILGATGSVGSQTLRVCERHASRISVLALSTHTRTKALVEAAHHFEPAYVAVSDPAHANDPILSELPEKTVLLTGPESLTRLASLPEADVVLNALLGFSGLSAAVAALAANKRLAYANKESIVVGGDWLMRQATHEQIIPVDSEHSALFECLVGERPEDVRELLLTCSGGPFFGYSKADLAKVTLSSALRHPSWSMGTKITIDSATLMNKGLELIEAHHLFSIDFDRIRVLIHPQSRIHSLVGFMDGSYKAQIASADMRGPIQYALSYPDRWETSIEELVWDKLSPWTFAYPDEKTFGCLRLAREAGRVGHTLPCILNAANEVANQAFRDERIGFVDIEKIIERCLDKHSPEPIESLEHLYDLDSKTRLEAESIVKELA